MHDRSEHYHSNDHGRSRPHLWEVRHPYYCATRSGYSRRNYTTWTEFVADLGDRDIDMYLVFRWDWLEESQFNGDVNCRNGSLTVFWMLQRNGEYQWTEIKVCRADEPAIREWLQVRLYHLLTLWVPLT